MDEIFINYLESKRIEARQRKLVDSSQILLGELIAKLRACEDQNATVAYDFEYLYPTKIDSWRGSCDV